MAEPVGFDTMAGAKAARPAPEIGVGMLGYAFMGKHTRMRLRNCLTCTRRRRCPNWSQLLDGINKRFEPQRFVMRVLQN